MLVLVGFVLGKFPGQGMCSQRGSGVGLVVKYISVDSWAPEIQGGGGQRLHKFL